MVDDHEGDIQIARLCFAKSRLSNPWLSFTDSLDALSYLRIAAHDPQKVPGLLLVEMHMGMMDGFTFLERASAIHGGTLPCPAVLLTHPGRPVNSDAATEAGATLVFERPRSVRAYVAFFDEFETVSP